MVDQEQENCCHFQRNDQDEWGDWLLLSPILGKWIHRTWKSENNPPAFHSHSLGCIGSREIPKALQLQPSPSLPASVLLWQLLERVQSLKLSARPASHSCLPRPLLLNLRRKQSCLCSHSRSGSSTYLNNLREILPFLNKIKKLCYYNFTTSHLLPLHLMQTICSLQSCDSLSMDNPTRFLYALYNIRSNFFAM